MLTSVDLIGNLTYVLLAFSYWTRSIVWLRLLTIPACICGLTFGFMFPTGPIWVLIFWNAVFLSINGYQLIDLWLQSKQSIDEPLRMQLNSLLGPIAPSTLTALMANGEVKDHLRNECIIEESEPQQRLFFLFEGKAIITSDDRPIANCEAPTLLGDIGFVLQNPSSASVSLIDGSKTISWDAQKLRQMMATQPELEACFNRCFSTEISKKLLAKERSQPTSELQRFLTHSS